MAAAVALEATTLEGQALELASKFKAAERDASTADLTIDNSDLSVDADTNTATISFTLPIEFSTVNGEMKVVAAPYLP